MSNADKWDQFYAEHGDDDGPYDGPDDRPDFDAEPPWDCIGGDVDRHDQAASRRRFEREWRERSDKEGV